MYIKDYNALFLHIPRTGGTSVERLFGYMGGMETYDESKGMNQDHRTAKEVKPLLGTLWDSCFKFTIVRNPWDKMASMYYYRLNSPFYNSVPNEWENQYRKKHGDNPTFERWLERLEWANNKVRLTGCFDQLNYITVDKEVVCDLIIDFSNMNEGWQQLKNMLNCDMDLPHLNKSKNKKSYKALYNSKTDSIIKKRFAKDIEYFGYKL